MPGLCPRGSTSENKIKMWGVGETIPLLSEVSMPTRGPWINMPRKGPQKSFSHPKHRQMHQSTHKPKARDRTQNILRTT